MGVCGTKEPFDPYHSFLTLLEKEAGHTFYLRCPYSAEPRWEVYIPQNQIDHEIHLSSMLDEELVSTSVIICEDRKNRVKLAGKLTDNFDFVLILSAKGLSPNGRISHCASAYLYIGSLMHGFPSQYLYVVKKASMI